MNTQALSTEVKASPVEAFVGDVLPPSKARDVAAALPAHVDFGRFRRSLANAIMAEPRLMKCDPRLVFKAVSDITQLGLFLDPMMGEAYLIYGWDGRRQAPVPQLRVGYRGYLKLARQSGEIAKVYAHEICENDVVQVQLGDEKRLTHQLPAAFTERGEVIAYYAVAVYKSGETDFEVMTVDEVQRIRDRSDAWKAFAAGKIKSTPWSTDEGEMSKKTVLRRLLKRLPLSPDLAYANRIENAADPLVNDDPPVRKPRPSLTDTLDRLAAPSVVDDSYIEGEVTEVDEDGVVAQKSEAEPPRRKRRTKAEMEAARAEEARKAEEEAKAKAAAAATEQDREKALDAAFNSGGRAFNEGKPRTVVNRPYNEDDELADAWREGWDAAKEDAQATNASGDAPPDDDGAPPPDEDDLGGYSPD